MGRVALLLGAAALIVFGAWSHLLDRSLWHDEEQIAFAAGELLDTGRWRHLNAAGVVGENLGHPLDDDGRLTVMSPGEIWIAALGRRLTGDWETARLPFAFAGALAGLVTAMVCMRATGVAAAGALGLGIWFLIPWTWTMSVQLRYYPLCWLLLALVLWAREERWHPLVPTALLLASWFVSWTLLPVFLVVLAVRDRLDPDGPVIRWTPLLSVLVPVVLIDAWAVSGIGPAMLAQLDGGGHDIARTFAAHLAEFNLDVFPLALLALMVVWAGRRGRPWVLACLVVPLFLVVPRFYTRLCLMLLPLFVVALVVVMTGLARRRPWLASTVTVLYLVTGFWSSLPGVTCDALSEKLGRHWMPLDREVVDVFRKPVLAWSQALSEPDPALDRLVTIVMDRTSPGEGVICAVGGTGLHRRTGRTVHWKRQAWMGDRPMPRWIDSPEGVRLVVVRRQWPWQSRSTTWTPQIVELIDRGTLPARRLATNIVELRLWNSPFPWSRERQAWPETGELEVWLLDEPLSAAEAELVMARDPVVLGPPGAEGDPDVVFGYPR